MTNAKLDPVDETNDLIFCCGGSTGYAEPFSVFGDIHSDESLLPYSKLMILTGGSDINPKIYGEPWYKEKDWGGYNIKSWFDDRRDNYEIEMYNEAVKLGIPVFGTCRGLQLIHALNGGKLIQHVDGHHGHHKIMTCKGEAIVANSIHHQACIPLKDGTMKILATAMGDNIVEAAYYPGSKSLGVQYHPEMLADWSPARLFAVDMVAEILNLADNGLLKVA